jgi:hypothetical protein
MELLALVPVPADVARELVPRDYVMIVEPAGTAVAIIGLKHCQDVNLDGQPIGPASTSDVGVLVEAPDGSDGFHYYQTWWTTNNFQLHRVLLEQGWPSILAGSALSVDAPVPALALAASAQVLWRDGAYNMTAAPFPIAPGGNNNRAVGWHDGEFGTLAVDKTLDARETGTGLATVSMEEGSPLERLVGATTAQGAALWSVYYLTGNVGLA